MASRPTASLFPTEMADTLPSDLSSSESASIKLACELTRFAAMEQRFAIP